jgi:multidrug resistance efflux pump
MSGEDQGMSQRVGEQGGRLSALEARTERIEDKVDQLLDQVAQAKGGWKTLMLVAGVAGTVGAIGAKLIAASGFLPR